MEKKVNQQLLDAVIRAIPPDSYSVGRDVGRTHGIVCHYSAGRLVATERWCFDDFTRARQFTFTIEVPEPVKPCWRILELSHHSALWLVMDCKQDGKLVHSSMRYVTSHTELPVLSAGRLYELLESAAIILAREGNVSMDTMPFTHRTLTGFGGN